MASTVLGGAACTDGTAGSHAGRDPGCLNVSLGVRRGVQGSEPGRSREATVLIRRGRPKTATSPIVSRRIIIAAVCAGAAQRAMWCGSQLAECVSAASGA